MLDVPLKFVRRVLALPIAEVQDVPHNADGLALPMSGSARSFALYGISRTSAQWKMVR